MVVNDFRNRHITARDVYGRTFVAICKSIGSTTTTTLSYQGWVNTTKVIVKGVEYILIAFTRRESLGTGINCDDISEQFARDVAVALMSFPDKVIIRKHLQDKRRLSGKLNEIFRLYDF